jgi:hypothetical protein
MSKSSLHRRDFLKVGSAGLLGMGLAQVLRLEARGGQGRKRRADNAILIWLAGGPATIDMWDPKPMAPDNIRGEFKAIETSATGIQIGEHLPHVARVMDRCSLVRSLHHGLPVHGPGTQYVVTGNKPTPALEFPNLGALASKLLPEQPGVPSNIAFASIDNTGGGCLGPAYNPFMVEGGDGKARVSGISLPDGFTTGELADRDRLMRKFDRRFQQFDADESAASLSQFQQQALEILRSDRVRKAFDLDLEPAPVRERYGSSPLARSALTARRLIEAGARFVTLGLGGWDTHAANFAQLRNNLLPKLDGPLAALIDDLDERGLLETTIVYCAGEFNRTPRINSQAGRDHWARSMSVLLAGGPIRRGHAYGSTDSQGMAPENDPCSPDDVAATIFHCLGLEPHEQVTSSSGRPITLFKEGNVLEGLLA